MLPEQSPIVLDQILLYALTFRLMGVGVDGSEEMADEVGVGRGRDGSLQSLA